MTDYTKNPLAIVLPAVREMKPITTAQSRIGCDFLQTKVVFDGDPEHWYDVRAYAVDGTIQWIRLERCD